MKSHIDRIRLQASNNVGGYIKRIDRKIERILKPIEKIADGPGVYVTRYFDQMSPNSSDVMNQFGSLVWRATTRAFPRPDDFDSL